MIKTILIASSAVVFMSCNDGAAKDEPKQDSTAATTTSVMLNNVLTEQETKDGWVLLFDGTSTKGWHTYGHKPVGAGWKIGDSSLYLDGNKANRTPGDGGDIVTDNEYDNFHLKYDWKIDTGGNSGLIFYVKEDTAMFRTNYNSGAEMQVLDNERHSDAKIPKHRAGDLYDLIASSSEPVKPALEWNMAEIKSINGKLDFYLNGVNIVSTTMWDDNWKKLIAGSKFKDMKGFGTFKKGAISLQDHGNGVWYRNIKIQKL